MRRTLLQAARRLWRTCVYIPDDRIGWLLPALLQAGRILRDHEISVIYSTSDPFTDHLVGYLLARVTGKPWVADFRDPWTWDAYYPHRNGLRRHLDRWMERQFLLKAAIITVTSDATAAQFAEKCPEVDAEKFVTITNGFDGEDFTSLTPAPPLKDDGVLTIVYSGRFASEAHFSPWFLGALWQLVQANTALREHIAVWFVGLFGDQASALVEELGLTQVVRSTGYLAHRDALGYLFQADVFLLTLAPYAGSEVQVPGKLFEYIAARKPILALVPEGAAAELVRETGSGFVVPPDDVVAIEKALYRLWKQHEQGRLRLSPSESLGRFTRKNLTARLAEVLEEVRHSHDIRI
jgi:glycosyltransferase involved in cell wall biosynthesis